MSESLCSTKISSCRSRTPRLSFLRSTVCREFDASTSRRLYARGPELMIVSLKHARSLTVLLGGGSTSKPCNNTMKDAGLNRRRVVSWLGVFSQHLPLMRGLTTSSLLDWFSADQDYDGVLERNAMAALVDRLSASVTRVEVGLDCTSHSYHHTQCRLCPSLRARIPQLETLSLDLKWTAASFSI